MLLTNSGIAAAGWVSTGREGTDTMRDRNTVLKKLLMGKEIVVAPGAYDALSARLVEKAGFSVVYITGAGLASSRLGVPDIGLTTMSEVLDSAKNIVNSTQIPVICDTDTGYGNAMNVFRTTREFEQAGVSAIQVEDQVFPKRCGHTEGKRLISMDEMVGKIAAVNAAKRSDSFMLIARTDAIAVSGFEEAICRARAYADAGADIIFIEAPRTIEELRRIPRLISHVPLMVNMVEGGGKTPLLSAKQLEQMGFRMVIYPVSAWMAAIKGIEYILKELKEHGTTTGVADRMVSFREMFELVGMSYYRDLEGKWLSAGGD